jgi:Tol biopolymer transport system component/DNA-binding winged helix-turn-helix (wHTH) protein
MTSTDPDQVDRRPAAEVLHFGAFTLDLQRRGLYRGSHRVHLTAKPLETLIALVEHRGTTLDKQRLLDLVWGHTSVTEGTLVQAIREIRRVLEDDKEDPVFVQTVPRQGYRFIGRVTADASTSPATAVPAPAGPPPADMGVPFRGNARKRALALVSLATLGAIVFGLWLRSPVGHRGTGSPESALPLSAPLQQLTHGIVSAVKPAISPDGKVMLFVSSGPETPGVLDLHVMPTGGGNVWRITETANASGDLPVFWPDGTAVVFSRYRSGEDGSRLPDLWRVPSFGGPMELFVPQASGAGFSPDGRRVVYTKFLEARRPLWVSRLDALGAHEEIAPAGYVPRWSPDGRWIAYTTSEPEGGLGDLFVFPLDGGPARRLTHVPSQFYGLVWTPDSQAIVASSTRTGSSLLWRHPIDGGDPELLLSGVGTYTAPSMSPDGRTLVFCFTRASRDVMVVDDLDGPGARTLSVSEYHRAIQLSPSGTRLAGVLEMSGSDARLYVADLAGGSRRELQRSLAPALAWMDEDQLAYVVNGQDRRRATIHALRLSTSRVRDVASVDGTVSWMAFRRRGRDVAFVRETAAGESQIVARDLDTGRERRLLHGGRYAHVRWVPGRDAISWSGPEVAADGASNGVWMVGLQDVQPRRLIADGYNPVWTADGSAIYFSQPREMDDGLWRFELASGASTRLRRWQRVPVFDVVGNTLVYLQDSGRSQIYSVALR